MNDNDTLYIVEKKCYEILIKESLNEHFKFFTNDKLS